MGCSSTCFNVNFASTNGALSWLLGGLNFQIEHHLFPRISHIHYPAISVFVREACLTSRVAYNEYTTMGKALRSHIGQLRRLGRKSLPDNVVNH